VLDFLKHLENAPGTPPLWIVFVVFASIAVLWVYAVLVRAYCRLENEADPGASTSDEQLGMIPESGGEPALTRDA